MRVRGSGGLAFWHGHADRPQRRPRGVLRHLGPRGRRGDARASSRAPTSRAASTPVTRRRSAAPWPRPRNGASSSGAQVGYRDLAGFGRRRIDMDPADLTADVLYQLGALEAMCRVAGTRVAYVKPHGALYTTAAVDEVQARAVVDAVVAYDPALPVLCQPGSVLHAVAEAAGAARRRRGLRRPRLPRRRPARPTVAPRRARHRPRARRRAGPAHRHRGHGLAVDGSARRRAGALGVHPRRHARCRRRWRAPCAPGSRRPA